MAPKSGPSRTASRSVSTGPARRLHSAPSVRSTRPACRVNTSQPDELSRLPFICGACQTLSRVVVFTVRISSAFHAMRKAFSKSRPVGKRGSRARLLGFHRSALVSAGNSLRLSGQKIARGWNKSPAISTVVKAFRSAGVSNRSDEDVVGCQSFRISGGRLKEAHFS